MEVELSQCTTLKKKMKDGAYWWGESVLGFVGGLTLSTDELEHSINNIEREKKRLT